MATTYKLDGQALLESRDPARVLLIRAHLLALERVHQEAERREASKGKSK